jgi:hypothetical protein
VNLNGVENKKQVSDMADDIVADALSSKAKIEMSG